MWKSHCVSLYIRIPHNSHMADTRNKNSHSLIHFQTSLVTVELKLSFRNLYIRAAQRIARLSKMPPFVEYVSRNPPMDIRK